MQSLLFRYLPLGAVACCVSLGVSACASGSQAQDDQQLLPLTLLVSNQSPVIETVDISITVDDSTVVDQQFESGMQHSWQSFATSVAAGERRIRVVSRAGEAEADTVVSVDSARWAIISFLYDPGSINNPSDRTISIRLQSTAPRFK